MFCVTDAACAHLAEVLEGSQTPDDEGLVARIVYEEGGLALTMGNAQADDVTFAHEGVTVLAIAEELSQALTGRTLDIETTDEGQRLALRESEAE